MEKLTWDEFKTFISGRNTLIQYIEFTNYYLVIGIDGHLKISTKIAKISDPAPVGSSQKDFEDNYKSDANIPLQDYDHTGRRIYRPAATAKGWHYQAHSIQFEVNKLDSVYNKDSEGNDLGHTSLKIYKENGDECTTQGLADTYGVKTVVKWDLGYDFEIVAGSIKQLVKETVNSYLYVNAKIATGLAAPNDWLPVKFTDGGINLNYIGADEPLKTDGRAAKLIKGSNGDHFEIIANYQPDLLTNTNRHKMSIIFEIFKDPTA